MSLLPGKHWYTRSRPPLSNYSAKYNELGWRRRLQSLQSIDEGFQRILGNIDTKNTTIIFTSDNGFYFGEWGMVLDKRQPYEVSRAFLQENSRACRYQISCKFAGFCR